MKNKTQITRLLGYAGILASILVGTGEYLLHYSPHIFDKGSEFSFFSYVDTNNLFIGHFFAIAGIPFYFLGYIHIYKMLKSGNIFLAQATLILGFIAFTVGGVWIGSRSTIGTIVHLKDHFDIETYDMLILFYKSHLEILVQVLRIVVLLLSVSFSFTILKGETLYNRWMSVTNPIVILILLVIIGKLIPTLGQHILPILMNVTHFILFSLSLYQLNQTKKI